MKVIIGILIAFLAIWQPTQALLGAKLALLSALTGGGGGRSGGGYGSGGYNGGYNQGYYSGPVRTPAYYGSGVSYGNSEGYGSGGGYGSAGGYGSGGGYGSAGGGGSYVYSRPSYGGGYGSGYQYGGGYSSGGEQVVRVIKVIVPQQQEYSSGGSVGYSSGWTPISAPGPVPLQPSTSYVTTQAVAAPQPVVQVVSAQSPVQISQQAPVQVSRPIQVAGQQPISVALQPPSGPGPQSFPQNIQSSVKTIKVIVDEPSWSSAGYSGHVPSQTYGPPSVASVSSVPSVWGQNGPAWGSSGWSSGGAGSWNNGLKSGGIWEKLGC